MRPPRLGLPAALLSLTMTTVAMAQNDPHKLDAVTVTASRSQEKVGETPQKVTIITRQQLDEQLAITGDQAQVLSNLIPSFSPSRQKLSGAGQTLRGRAPLYMVDGIPQSNPLRPGSRDGYTLDLSLVERIEVIHGATAEHGLGATGGIINFVTRRPQGTQTRQHAGAMLTSPDDFDSDGLGYKLNYRLEGLHDNWDFLAGVTYQSRGMFYDADGKTIGVDNAQGDIMDSQSHDVMVKVGYWIDDNQNVELSINRFFLESNHDYQEVPGDRDIGIPTTSRKAAGLGDPVNNDVWTSSLSYKNMNFLGNNIQAQLYTQRFRARYGADTTYLQDPNIAPTGTLVEQSQNESDKVGAKFTLIRDGLLDDRLKLTTGLDLLQDETRQRLIQTDRDWVPETQFRNIAPFLQAQYKATDRITIHGGARYEYAKLNVDDFTTIYQYNATNPPASKPGVAVEGGNPSFDDTLYNAGVTFQITEAVQLFANYSEGFGMPDVGRVLRAISVPGQSVDTFLDLRPIVTDNKEAGIRVVQGPVDFEVSYFRSDADLGSRLSENPATGVFEVQRQKTEIHGAEASLGWAFREGHRLGASYAHVSGKYDSDDDNHVDTRMGARDIPPDHLTLSWQARWTDRFSTYLQGTRYFSLDFNDPEKKFDGYNLFDLSLAYRLPKGQLNAGIENFLDQDYFTYFSQSATTRSDQYFKGRGRVFTIGYNLDF
ncbi:Fe transport outer membrane receptor protein [Alcanivorax xiamenensis]|uniref:Fe transport outer membrane receptor protein n=1 Tax=Alcanivorax xiamenensis TaxID=1177156 RepID=A0ABQ6YCI5_9GAMM|nr:TonB-dependent receptor [Alcanivorax xiamenensis]KAF0807686.1 Fe transport outer membrane receptor protein [Alcanivorax xiamenensis]